MDLYARPWRDLAAVGHPAGLMFDTITGRTDELVCNSAYIFRAERDHNLSGPQH